MQLHADDYNKYRNKDPKLKLMRISFSFPYNAFVISGNENDLMLN